MENKKLREFFSMTRSERIGSYTLLIILSIVVACAVGYRSCAGDESKAEYANEQLLRIKTSQSMRDSLMKEGTDSIRHKCKKSRKRKKVSEKRGKYSDRDLPEVPQY